MSSSELFKALADPVRRDILSLLKQGRKSAGEISSNYELTSATVSYHLGILKRVNLICEEKEKNYIYYSINTSVLEDVLMWFLELKGEQNE